MRAQPLEKEASTLIAKVVQPHPPRLPAPTAHLPHAELIRRLNTTVLIAAREAAQCDLLFAAATYSVTLELAQWLAAANIDEVLDLASTPVCVFGLRLPERAVEKLAQATARTTVTATLPLAGLHTALLALQAT